MTRSEFESAYSRFCLADFIATQSTNQVKKLLKTFRCAINPDLQDFLHNKAIVFDKNLRSRSYLYIDNIKKNAVAGYFTLAINYLETTELNSKIVQILDGHKDDIQAIPCYLVGQLAVSDEFVGEKIGRFLLDDAIEIIGNSQRKLGGRFVLIDSVNDNQVIAFYERNSFIAIENNKKLKSIKMIKPYFDCESAEFC